MTVVRHSDPRAFLTAAAAMLARDEANASKLMTWAQGLVDHPPTDEPVYLATYAADGAFGAAFLRGTYAVFIANSDPAAAGAFARDLAVEWPQLQGVAGAGDACEAFAHAWSDATARTHRLRFHLRNHILTEVAFVPAPGGVMRNADAADLEWLVAAEVAFIAAARLPDDPARVRVRLPERIADGRIRIWDDREPIAFAGWSASGGDAARIAPVWTVASARRRGYATALVAALARELLARGSKKIFLDTDLANPTSNAIYARVGFRPLHDFYHFDFVAP